MARTSATRRKRAEGPRKSGRTKKAAVPKTARRKAVVSARAKKAVKRPVAAKKTQQAKETAMLSKSTQRAKWIESPDEHEDRQGQTLATRNHEVIKKWAEERKAAPATVPGSRYDGRPGVLRFDFEGYGGKGLEHISWEEWFESFDERQLVFVFQEHLKKGNTSNFFHLDNPQREAA